MRGGKQAGTRADARAWARAGGRQQARAAGAGQAASARQGARRSAGGAQVRGARQAGAGHWARGLARAVHSVHSAWFSTRFFDSVFFLSHQMNTVHCKINFEKKNIFFKFN